MQIANWVALETFAEAQKCAALFRKHADEIDAYSSYSPNFGDEKGVADTIKLSGTCKCPYSVQASPIIFT